LRAGRDCSRSFRRLTSGIGRDRMATFINEVRVLQFLGSAANAFAGRAAESRQTPRATAEFARSLRV
jgi:hypothetical protein